MSGSFSTIIYFVYMCVHMLHSENNPLGAAFLPLQVDPRIELKSFIQLDSKPFTH